MDPRNPEPDPELRRALEAWRPEVPSPELRDELRERFLDAPTEPARAADLEAALDSVRPSARPEFRTELRERFLSALDELEPLREDEERPPVRPSSRRRSSLRADVADTAQDGRRRLRWIAGGGAAALAAAAALVIWLMLPGDALFEVDPDLFVADGLTVDGEPLPSGATAADLAALLGGARTVATTSDDLRIVYGDQFVLELGPETSLDLTGLGDEGPLVLGGTRGAFRVATGPGFDAAARPLEFHTPVRSLRVMGTVFGVDVFDGGKVCICCNEGEVDTWLTGLTGSECRAAQVAATWTLLTTGEGDETMQHLDAHQAPLTELARWNRWP